MPEGLPLAATIAPLGLPPREGLAAARSLGVRAVQVSATQPGLRPRDLDQAARRDLLAALRRMELLLAGLDLWIPAAHFASPAEVDRAVDAATAAIELAADLGRVPVSVSLPPRGEGPAEAAVQTLAQHAERFGVEIADHAAATALRAGVGVGIDPAIVLAAGDDPAMAVASVGGAGGRLVTARLVDFTTGAMRAPLGEPDGRLDVVSYRAALDVAGYARPVVIDARQWRDARGGIARTMQLWQAKTVVG